MMHDDPNHFMPRLPVELSRQLCLFAEVSDSRVFGESFVLKLNKQLSVSLAGVSASTVDRRSMAFTLHKVQVFQDEFASHFVVEFGNWEEQLSNSRCVFIHEFSVHCFACQLFQNLDKVWTSCIAMRGTKPLIDELSDDEVCELLGGSCPTVYYLGRRRWRKIRDWPPPPPSHH